MDNVLTFTAIRGVQAGREYYSAMCPLKVIPKVFMFDEEELSADLRAQRTLNRARIPEIAHYIVANPRDYIFSSITTSVDGTVTFEPHGTDGMTRNIGRLLIPMTSRFLINDGQHRRAAIEEALKKRPELGDESISVVFFVDAGLKRSQQMFADLNRHAIRPTKSIGILYDHRDPLSQLAREIADRVAVFRGRVEMEKTTISNRSNKLHTLSSIFEATKVLLGKKRKCTVSTQEREVAVEFWQTVADQIPDWGLAASKKVSCAELRRDYVHAHGICLQAIGLAGASLLDREPKSWKKCLTRLKEIDWSRSSDLWNGRALVAGRVSKAFIHVNLTANHVKKTLGIPLTTKDKQYEATLRKDQKSAA